jgi:threonine dehydrogenase-like Zn-dependent dehydrogenase
MKAIRFDGTTAAMADVRKPRSRKGEALIHVTMAAICSTDLEILRGYMDFRGTLGHEFVGRVEASQDERLVGRRVVGEIAVPCRTCPICTSGLMKHCPHRGVIGISGRDGTFAEYLLLPNENLHEVPDSLSDEEAVFVELLAAACEIPVRVPFRRESRVVVLGDGRLAAMAAQVVAMHSDDVLVLGLNTKKLSIIGGLGIPTEVITNRGKIKGKFDIVVECTGKPTGLPLAVELVRPQGIVVLKSTYHASLDWNPAPIVVNEITVVGSRCGPFGTALQLLIEGKVKARPFITATYELADFEKAILRARHSNSFKVLMKVS